MYAGVVNVWGQAPQYSTIDLPEPTSTQVRVKVLAASVHNLVRLRAAGKHFSVAGKTPPHVPGTDGVGTVKETGELVYFNSFTTPTGSFAEEINVEKSDIFPLSKNADPVEVAVMVNPTVGSWMALTARAGLVLGSNIKVAIIGATGVSGQAAVQVSKAFGAVEIVTIGKAGAKLEKTKELGATATITLAMKLEETDFSAAADVDVVLDFLWGDVSTAALPSMISKRKNKTQRLTWIQIGELAGANVPIPATLLRMANLVLLGSAPGSWTFGDLNQQLPAMLNAITVHGLKTDFTVKKLAEIESWWNEQGGPRLVMKPSW
ncbi:GroES-like protein [Amniculicola lignicola CBS 123094]|uniref:GroES-like protein n=1 Tax=Amniculicola lignicola CBS 123094 TaxID=1392246 RepID=A0A6A5WEK8_9PLEO|nr:GroES-like protein [Amniculicola lignicola CBS 123094]